MTRHRIRSADAPYVQSFERTVRAQGWNDTQVDVAIEWYTQHFKPGMPPAEAYESFEAFAGARGIDAPDRSVAHAWYSVSSSRIDAGQSIAGPTSNRSADKARLEETRAIIRQDPERAREFEAEQIGIIARLQGSVVTPPAPRPDDVRLAEIRAARRADPDKYDNSPAIKAEELRLLSGPQSENDS